MTDATTRTRFAERARQRWTAERVRELTGTKQLLVRPDNAPNLLRAVGVLDARAELHPSRVRKYRQVNHLLSFLRPALDELAAERSRLQLVDAGCGRSTLGFLVAWWMKSRGLDGQVLGLDRNPAVIGGCRRRAEQAGLNMAFAVADLEAIDLPELWHSHCAGELSLDGVLALHACDTATDAALVVAVRHRSRFFAVAPCCQAELARSWEGLATPPLALLQQNPHLRRSVAASVTDAMRAELMGARGYRVRVTEFVEAHHTPKNTLIYGHLQAGPGSDAGYHELKRSTGGCGIALERWLEPTTRPTKAARHRSSLDRELDPPPTDGSTPS